ALGTGVPEPASPKATLLLDSGFEIDRGCSAYAHVRNSPDKAGFSRAPGHFLDHAAGNCPRRNRAFAHRVFNARMSVVELAQNSRFRRAEWFRGSRASRTRRNHGPAFPPRICRRADRTIQEGSRSSRLAHFLRQQLSEYA